VVKQVAGLDGENSRPSRLLEVAADVSYLGADLFDHRTAHFHPLWALFDSCEFLTRYFTWILPRLVTLTFPDFLNFFCWNFLLARRVGGRFKYLWLATIFHGLTVECAAYWLPDIDNFWHSQTTIVLLGRRLPIHIMMLCNHPYALIDLWFFVITMLLIADPAFIYNASVAISRLRLPNWAEPFAGYSFTNLQRFNLLVETFLFDSWNLRGLNRHPLWHYGSEIPSLDMVWNQKRIFFNFLKYQSVLTFINNWRRHDTDPNIFDRHYWVPWNSFYFHATFAASFTFWFHCWRRLIIGKSADKWVAGEYVVSLLFLS
jgi:hypothetical protein